jgi:hypothetical protein
MHHSHGEGTYFPYTTLGSGPAGEQKKIDGQSASPAQ